MRESTKSLTTDTSSSINDNINFKEAAEILLLIIKFVSSGLLLLVFLLQFECLLQLILKLITNNNTFLKYSLTFIFHFFLLRFGVQSFLFILHFPILKSLCFYYISCAQLRQLLEVANEFVALYKNLKNQKKTFDSNEKLLIKEISNIVNFYLENYKDIKLKCKINKNQNDLYEKLCSWMKNYDEYKNNFVLTINNKENDNENADKKTFIYYLRKMNNDSKEIIKILDNFICDNYQIFSNKRLYNCFINNTFCSLSQYSLLFNQKFNNKFKSFVTSDNKIIDYSIVTYNKLNKIYKNKNIIKNENEKISKNLLFFCNPNGMIYQLFTPEKFLFLLEAGCDILFWNYRGYGYSTGCPNFKNTKTDIVELFDYIKKKNKYKKYGVCGYSVGGGSATFLCKKRNLDLLICDRNYTSVTEIARTISIFGEVLYYLEKMLYFRYDYNINEFMNTKNKNICKIVLCDPGDEIIPNYASLKSGISTYIIKKYCIKNNIKQTENILDIFLDMENDIEQKNKFINSLLNIMDILIEFNKNPFRDLIIKKKSNKNEENLDNTLLLNINDNNDLNKKNFNRKLINTVIRFFKCFNFSSENLETFKEIEEKRLKILHIHNYFNNFFIWGTISNKGMYNADGFLNPFDIKNNIDYLNEAIENLNKFLDDKFIKSMAVEGECQEKYNNIMIIRNCLKILKNNNEFLNSIKNINIGILIRLDCGHNGLYSEIDKKNLIDILKDVKFINYN